MEDNFADLLTDAFSEISVLSFPEGELDFEPLNFEEVQTDITSPGRLSVLREEEENVDESDEWKRPGCETVNVSEHIPLETYVNLNKEDIQHIEEKEEEEKEEEKEEEEKEEEGDVEYEEDEEGDVEDEEDEEGDVEDEEESLGQTGRIHEHISMETYDVCLNDKEDEEERSEEEEDEEEEMGSREEEDIRVESSSSPRDWSMVSNDDSCDGEDTENSDVRCFEGLTGDATLEITEGQKAEDHSTDDNYESSDSDLEVLTSATTENQTEDGIKMDTLSHQVLQEDEEEKGDRASNVGFDYTGHKVVRNVQSRMEHPLEDKMKVFLGESFLDHPPDFSVCEHDKGARKGETEKNQKGGMMPRPYEPNESKGKVDPGQRMAEEQVRQQERQGQGDEEGEQDEDGEEPTAALSLSANANQVFADCAVCKSDIDSSMGRVAVVPLEPGSSSESYSDSSSDSSSDDEKFDPIEPNQGDLARSTYQEPPWSDLESKFSPLQNHWEAGGEDASKQRLANMPPPENITDVNTLTHHSETEPCRAPSNISEATGNNASSNSEESLLCTLSMSEDKQKTWLRVEAGPGPLEVHHQPEIQLDVAGRLESPTHTDVRWDTGDNTVDIGGSQEDGYEVFAFTDRGDEEFEDDRGDEEFEDDRGDEEFEDEEDEDERNWEKEKLRIDAFYQFYNNEGGEEEIEMGTDHLLSGKKPRVQFCMEPLPQVIEYTDSSDMDLSTDGETDLDSTDRFQEQNDHGILRKGLSESNSAGQSDSPENQVAEGLPEIHSAEESDIQENQVAESLPESHSAEESDSQVNLATENLPESHSAEESDSQENQGAEGLLESQKSDSAKDKPVSLKNQGAEEEEPINQENQAADIVSTEQSKTTQTQSRRNWVLTVLKFILKMTVVMLMGLAMFWWTTDQMDWSW